MDKNKPLLKVLIVLGVIAILALLWFKGKYNNMVVLDEGVKTAWSQVENQYQRRLDLIPNLVATVQGYASHERETLEGVIEARSRATSINITPSNMSQINLEQFQAAQNQLSGALSRLMVVLERYPELKANQNFLELQAQLEGTENRIAVERMRFNEAAQKYNTFIRLFPANIVASLFNFEQKPYFAAQEGSDRAPTVNFSGLSNRTPARAE